MHYEAHAGHIGGNLSCLDILMTLHHDVMQKDDVFILSKGHAAGALYVTLWSLGKLTDDDLKTFHQDGTHLPGHPPPCGGSLGHGLSIAAGIALGKKLQGQPGRVFCLCSDGEMAEGAIWEAIMFCSAHQLKLCLIVDNNGWQGFRSTHDAPSLTVGVVRNINGHHYGETMSAFGDPYPLVTIIARTVKGHGVAALEDRLDSHYLPLTAAQYEQALKELA